MGPTIVPPVPTINAMTFDVEEWFHAANLGIPPAQWSIPPSRLDQPLDAILSLLGQHGVRGTFFILGWVVSRKPELVRRIHEEGHEIASHGYLHRSIRGQSRSAFTRDVVRSKAILEDLIGQPVFGYRAPSYSISRETDWALDVLLELGFNYDSSIYPVRSPHRRYGVTGTPLEPYRIRPGLWEFPLPTLRLPGMRVPAATGAYLRIAPLRVTRWAIHQNQRQAIPTVVNVHPWELDVDQPRLPVSWWPRFLHYTNLHTTYGKLARLLSEYRFASLDTLRRAYELQFAARPRSLPVEAVLGTRPMSRPPSRPEYVVGRRQERNHPTKG